MAICFELPLHACYMAKAVVDAVVVSGCILNIRVVNIGVANIGNVVVACEIADATADAGSGIGAEHAVAVCGLGVEQGAYYVVGECEFFRTRLCHHWHQSCKLTAHCI